MKQATYNAIGGPHGHLANLRSFDGNSMSAQRRGVPGQPQYIVYSYATIIARVEVDGTVWVSDLYYSPTTSRHQNLCRAWLDHDPVEWATKCEAERIERETAQAESTRERLEAFLPDVTLVSLDSATELQAMFDTPDPNAEYRQENV